jgi:hypothetical protein
LGDTRRDRASVFVAAMVAFFLGLLSFLREIFLATANLRIGSAQTARAGG